MKKANALLLGLAALASTTAAFAGPYLDTVQQGRQVAQAKAQPAPVDAQKMMAQCQEMMKAMPMDMHSGAMSMSQGTARHDMASATSQAPSSSDTRQLFRGQ